MKNAETHPAKPFPWKCGHCGVRAVHRESVPDYTTEIAHDGRPYTVTLSSLEAPCCRHCGTLYLDREANEQISLAFRRQVHLLTPEEIRRSREALGLTQKELASRLGVAEATLSRWETGAQIQQQSLDRLLRLFFGLDVVRAALAGPPEALPLPELSG